MVRLHLFAEGSTEQTFAHAVLAPHLANHGVFMQKPVLIAHARKKGRTHRGGGQNFGAIQRDIERRLKEDKGEDAFFTTMIDLYALPHDFPEREIAESLRADPYAWVERLETAWRTVTGDARFVPHVQLHEYEAMLFADVSAFRFYYEKSDTQIARLQGIVDAYLNPELINDGQHTAPSKRIAVEFPEYADGKTTVGPQMAARIGLVTIRQKCPHFDKWLTRLESLHSG